MWQPNRAQWSIIWTVAVLVILGWPPDSGKSLAVKGVNWVRGSNGRAAEPAATATHGIGR